MVTRRILIIASLAIFLSMKMTALPKIVYDQKCIEAVGINTAYQNLAETSHNEMIDSIRIKQNSIMKYVTSMESMKELYSRPSRTRLTTSKRYWITPLFR